MAPDFMALADSEIEGVQDIMYHTAVTKRQAVELLRKYNGNVLKALSSLGLPSPPLTTIPVPSAPRTKLTPSPSKTALPLTTAQGSVPSLSHDESLTSPQTHIALSKPAHPRRAQSDLQRTTPNEPCTAPKSTRAEKAAKKKRFKHLLEHTERLCRSLGIKPLRQLPEDNQPADTPNSPPPPPPPPPPSPPLIPPSSTSDLNYHPFPSTLPPKVYLQTEHILLPSPETRQIAICTTLSQATSALADTRDGFVSHGLIVREYTAGRGFYVFMEGVGIPIRRFEVEEVERGALEVDGVGRVRVAVMLEGQVVEGTFAWE
ncbi:hypothetical protein NX059_011355 [Plenodomus lindquistii]|nr:hypothetical protein NX059_011355 [Plenodomus lindquistii]